MANFFPRWTNWLPLQMAIAGIIIACGLSAATWYYVTPKYTKVGYQPVQPVPRPPVLAGLPTGTETVLVVEDAEAIRSLARKVLTAQGYTVLEAGDGVEALQIAERHTGMLHLVLTDVVMPGMSGRELAQRLAPLRPQLKLLYMSGYTGDAVVHRGVLEDGLPFLAKPFTPEDLASKVRDVLDGLP